MEWIIDQTRKRPGRETPDPDRIAGELRAQVKAAIDNVGGYAALAGAVAAEEPDLA